ncbi:MAG: UDP-N-acetylmuramoyl-tripeptide--D-alanyl-D-alanine ligase [Clostridia bacterium]|nr:UDP-N-acetylmuramoyl-tripeptide--D-alanyl-D-alanine ligase [Clostridia bacterium]
MGIFISIPKTIECIAVAVVFAALLSGCAYRLCGILQSLGYGNKKFFVWAKKKANVAFSRHVLLTLLCVLSTAVIGLSFSFAGEYAGIIGLAGYAIFLPLYIWADNRVALRVPLSFTPRMKRLYAVLALLTAVVTYVSVTLLNFADYVWGSAVFSSLRYVPLSLLPLLLIPLVAAANGLAKIYEVPRNRGYIKKATGKLKNSQITVVGITGSFGKTSTKQILASMLSKKYRVLSTPRSHNTPLGLALSINSNDLNDYDIFIAEMGARHVGDIAELCELCPPKYALITGICPQHLESFGSEENIVKAKGEILSSCGEAVITGEYIDLFKAYPCPKSTAAAVSEIECGKDGSNFSLTFDGKTVKTHTKLLGAHAVDNIALAASLCYKLGMTAEEIAGAIPEIDYIEHRLQLIKSGDVNILDDGYNSNVKGAAAAIEVLKSFDGKKIVVTPGLVELGVLEESENYALGQKLIGLDYVILVGERLVEPVKKGYIDGGGDAEKIVTVLGLPAAQEKLKEVLSSGDTVLFLNDLPDVY